MLIYSNSQISGFMMTRGFVVDVCQLGASPDRHHLGLENFNQTEGCFLFAGNGFFTPLEMGFPAPSMGRRMISEWAGCHRRVTAHTSVCKNVGGRRHSVLLYLAKKIPFSLSVSPPVSPNLTKFSHRKLLFC